MTQPGDGRFADLGPRVLSGVVMAAVGIAAVWAGGLWFALLVALAVGAMVWELGRMLLGVVAPGQVRLIAGAAALGLVVAAASLWTPPLLAVAILVLPAIVAFGLLTHLRLAGAVYLAAICLAGHALIVLRGDFGLWWVVWLVLLVIGSDVAGYFAGRYIGGPKLWPRVSPKKTWSGTVAGWVLGVLIGAAFLQPLGMGVALLLLSLAVVIAGQAGDIAESALKRRVGVKDSSNLIPGHGGFLDRFDAMIGAALAFLVLARLGLAGTGGAG